MRRFDRVVGTAETFMDARTERLPLFTEAMRWFADDTATDTAADSATVADADTGPWLTGQ
jgi:hypothetical protein